MASKPYRITIRYLAAVAFIYLCTSIAWLYLGAVTDSRTHHKDQELRQDVGQIWGGVHRQSAPQVLLAPIEPVPSEPDSGSDPSEPSQPQPKTLHDSSSADAKQPEQGSEPPQASEAATGCGAKTPLSPMATVARAELDLEHRRKGLLWYSTYGVRFEGSYTVKNDSPCEREAAIWFAFPASNATYDDFSVEVGGEEVPFEVTGDKPEWPAHGALAAVTLAAGERAQVRVRYASRGLDRWSYSFGDNTARAKDFQLVVKTNFDKVDFPAGSLSPSAKQPSDGGWELTWSFKNLLADADIAVAMPRKINPGPLTSEISRFAPVSLFFFFFVLLLVMVIKKVRLHPVHFGLLAASFFSFHLLMAYLVDHVPMWIAFCASSVTSVALVISYLRLAVGPRFALLWAGGAQLLYLVLFSLAFFLDGYTGLTITVFSILTLFMVMQLTGRIDWSTVFVAKPAAPPPQPVPHPMGYGPVHVAGYGPPIAAAAGAAAGGEVFSNVS